jgi:hypothetical protein
VVSDDQPEAREGQAGRPGVAERFVVPLADRLEGKPVQVVDATVDDRHDIELFSDAELTAILRKRVKVVPMESDEQRPEDEPVN